MGETLRKRPGRKTFKFNLRSQLRLTISVPILAISLIGIPAESRSYPGQREMERALQSETKPEELLPGRTLEREIAGDEPHDHRITLRAGQFLHLILQQRGIDLVIRLFGPDGGQTVEVNYPNGAWGSE